MKSKLRIPRNVQFIYEHSLAREELLKGFQATGVHWDAEDPWTFDAELNGSKSRISNYSAYVGHIDTEETVYSKLIKPAYQGGLYNRTRSVNQYLTHWIYPYKGKFHPQMIRALINMANLDSGSVLFEPFCGSGTAALEAQILGFNIHAIDISPLCVKLTNVKTKAWEYADKIETIVSKMIEIGAAADQAHKFKSKVAIVNDFVDIARMVSLSDESNRGREINAAFIKNLGLMLQSIKAMRKAKEDLTIQFGEVTCIQDDIRNLSAASKAVKADLIVTSPPYSIALDYVKNDKHALEAMGLDTKEIKDNFIGVAGRGPGEKMVRYEIDMKAAFKSMASVLKQNGQAIVIIGNVTFEKEEVYSTEHFESWAKAAGLRLERELPKIVFGLYNVMADEKIMFFRRM